jgi:hypothetical protein
MRPKITVYTSSGTHTFDTNYSWARVIVTGGGGAGMVRTFNDNYLERHPGPGATAIKHFALEDTGPTATVTVAGEQATQDAQGGTSSFASSGIFVSATGGRGGSSSYYHTPTASGGDYNLSGTRGQGYCITEQAASNRCGQNKRAPYWGGRFGSSGASLPYGGTYNSNKYGQPGVVVVEEYE